jgi:hypothetical protein
VVENNVLHTVKAGSRDGLGLAIHAEPGEILARLELFLCMGSRITHPFIASRPVSWQPIGRTGPGNSGRKRRDRDLGEPTCMVQAEVGQIGHKRVTMRRKLEADFRKGDVIVRLLGSVMLHYCFSGCNATHRKPIKML